MQCVASTVKYVLFASNVVFSLGGLVLLALGVAVLIQARDMLEIMPVALIEAMPIAVMVVGGVIFVIAFFGCWGAIKESRCLLMMYAICVLVLAGGKIVILVLLFDGLFKLQDAVESWLGLSFNDNDFREAYHVMEKAFRCCGTTGPDSYVGILPELPPSCCHTLLPDGTCSRVYAYPGCNQVLNEYFTSFGGAVVSVILLIVVFELVAMAFALCLSRSIGNKRRMSV